MGDLIIKENRGPVCTLIINRPERRNALNYEALLRLGGALEDLRERSKVLVIRGAGEKAFCSGGDLKEVASAEEFKKFIESLEYFQSSLINYPFPVIAMIFGCAVGAGLDLAAMCDIRLAAENAFFSVNAVRIGRVYHHTSAIRLISLVGYGPASEMLLTGCKIDAARAEKIGLVSQVFPVDLLEEKVMEMALEMARCNHPGAVRNTKEMLIKLKNIKRTCKTGFRRPGTGKNKAITFAGGLDNV
ncbi:enoyl-CoA hydratase/isomerase family protein [Desulfallas sp. Bu1-1]|uniref:enoyl-CoA hydratase/isomerase family protein n=1 Tax=Desulfallas sp. Bu1-1 TaxID=2787620 RepID=UPI00189CCB1B|nr:enoyl-CoA hydratase/isomerase family protein [Desulfallas sp. Bu1-1]MBF7084519.1 enoyl-CoA hydratase/isomerase family protein [Desulfallas sp. Bu1-1]